MVAKAFSTCPIIGPACRSKYGANENLPTRANASEWRSRYGSRAHYRGLGQIRAFDQKPPGTLGISLPSGIAVHYQSQRGSWLRGIFTICPWPLEAGGGREID